MDETKPTSAPASAGRARLVGIIWSVTRAQAPLLAIATLLANAPWILGGGLLIIRGQPVGLGLGAIVSFLAVTLLLLFLLLVVPHALMDWFGFDEWARRRAQKPVLVDLRPFFAGLGRIFRPVLRLFTWWLPLRLGRFGEAVLLPDSMAIFVVGLVSLVMASGVMAGLCISILVGQPVSSRWLYLSLPGLAVLVSPFVLTTVLWVSREGVRLVRFFVVIPYWVHRVPHDAEFHLSSDSWDEPVFTGVVFTSRSRIGYGLELGISTSASRLYHHIAAVLERAGRKP